jgi:REP element-mobilizing transposase RayT
MRNESQHSRSVYVSLCFVPPPNHHEHKTALQDMRYRRALIKGATYFFPVNLAKRSSRLLVDRIDGGVDDLREVVRDVRQVHLFEIVAWILLPQHLHAMWALAERDSDYPMRWRLIEANFSHRVPSRERVCERRRKKKKTEKTGTKKQGQTTFSEPE